MDSPLWLQISSSVGSHGARYRRDGFTLSAVRNGVEYSWQVVRDRDGRKMCELSQTWESTDRSVRLAKTDEAKAWADAEIDKAG